MHSTSLMHLLEEAAHSAARRGWRSMGCVSEAVAYGLIVASYRRRLGIVVVREFARHRYRQSQPRKGTLPGFQQLAGGRLGVIFK